MNVKFCVVEHAAGSVMYAKFVIGPDGRRWWVRSPKFQNLVKFAFFSAIFALQDEFWQERETIVVFLRAKFSSGRYRVKEPPQT